MEKIKKFGKAIWDNWYIIGAALFLIISIALHIADNHGYQYVTSLIFFWSCMILDKMCCIDRKIDNYFKFNLPNLTNFNNLIEEYGEVDVKFTK